MGRVSLSGQLGRSRAAPGVGYLGPVPDAAWLILEVTWGDPLFVASNLAREEAAAVALLASLGWITTVFPDGHNYSRRWHVTAAGLTAMQTKGIR